MHLIVHALHEKVMISVFDKERLNSEIKSNEYYPEYKRSWKIVQENGSDKIIEEFKGFL